MAIEPTGTSAVSELDVPYDAALIAEKVSRRRRLMRSRLVSLGITVVVLGGLYLWQRDQLQGVGFLILSGLILAVSVALFVVFLVRYQQARKELGSVGSGTAVRMGPPGVEVAGLFAAWPEVASLAAVPGRLGRSPVLQLTTLSGSQASVSFDQIPTYPATLDSTARAFSGGRHGVDLTALDN
jgi:hypothetical protein